jgi:hypothetical protein
MPLDESDEVLLALMESQYHAGWKAGCNAAYRRYVEGDETVSTDIPYRGHLAPLTDRCRAKKAEKLK